MLVFTEDGLFYVVVKDWDGDFLWARSQDRRSIEELVEFLKAEHPERSYALMHQPDWDYEFRAKVTRSEWSDYLDFKTDLIQAGKFKPTVGAARGHTHPISRAVTELFYFMSENRPNGSKPAWLGGKAKSS
jgi:ferredoxin-NADP reductase